MLMSSNAPTGTQMKFNPVNGNDTMVKNGISKDITTKLMCVTAMQQYQNKSLEELRVEDYQASRKFPTAGSTSSVFGSSGTSSAFGSTGTTGGFGAGNSLFGGAQQTNNANTGSFFGGNKPSIFSNTSSPATGGGLFGNTPTPPNQQNNLFGGQPAQTNSLFGNTNVQKPSIFGSTPTQSTGSSLFGNTTTQQPATGFGGGNSLFGGSQQANTAGNTGMFNFNKPATLGTNTQQSTGLFGGGTAFGQQPTQSASTNLFQPAQTNPMFGNTNVAKPSIFGQQPTQPGTTGLFGAQPTQANPMFGNTNVAKPFGQQTSQPGTTGLFGAQPTQTNSMFGNAQKPSLFANTSNTAPTLGGGLFGGQVAQPQQSTGLFGAQTAQPQQSTGLFGNAFGGQQVVQAQQPQSVLTQQQPIVIGGESSEAAIRQAIIESQLAMYPYGDSRLLRSFSLKSNEDVAKEAVKSKMEKERQGDNYFATKLGKQDGLAEKDAEGVNKRYQQSVLSVGRPSIFNYKPLVQRNGFAATELNASADTAQTSPVVEQQTSHSDSFSIPKSNLFVPSLSTLSNKKRDNPKHLDLSILSSAVQENGRSARLATNTRIDTSNQTSTPLPASYELVPPRNLNFDITTSPQPRSNAKSDDSRLDVSLNESSQPSPFGRDVTQDSVVHQTTIQHGPVGITLSKRDIYTEPPIDELENFVQGGKVHLIDGFVVGRVGYGRIEWTGPISFSDVDLGDLVRFQRKQIVVYPDELKKPPIGQELNRKAIIALESIFPYNKETKEEIRDPLSAEAQAFSRVLERKCIKMDCDFLEYEAEKGIWMFRVKHFSRYGFFEDDDEEAAQPPKRHKAEPLRPIQENVEEQQDVDMTTSGLSTKHGRVLGFDESMHDAANFIDPKSLFVSNFDDGKFKRLGIAEDIMDFIESNALQDTHPTDKNYSIRKRVRTISQFDLDDKIFPDATFKQIVRLHGHPLARRIGFGPSSNTYVTALFDPHQSSSRVFVSKIKLVPTIEAYLLNYLESKNREPEFEHLVQTRVLCMKPASDFLRLVDVYLFDHLRNNFSLEVINKKMERFCAAICQDLGDVRFDILQRLAFVEWLREELGEDLEKKLESIKLTSKMSPYAAVFYCLHYGFIERAADVAAENGLFQLSLFIGMYINGRVSGRLSQYSKKMFDSMKQVNNADSFRRRVYAILARLLKFEHSGTPVDLIPSESSIQAFAIQLTYFATRKSDLNACMSELKAITTVAA